MTTSNDMDIIEPETEETVERSISELWDLPYSEMTDEEIARLIDYKAAIKARDETHEKIMTKIENALLNIVQINEKAAQSSIDTLNALTAHAIERFNEASNG